MIGRLGFTEILILVGIIFIFFGAKKLPDIAKSLAKGLKEFKKEIISKDEDSKPDSEEKKNKTEDNIIDK